MTEKFAQTPLSRIGALCNKPCSPCPQLSMRDDLMKITEAFSGYHLTGSTTG